MTSLTDRYVWAVVRLLAEHQRPEVDQELRSNIADMVEDRVTARSPGTSPDEEQAEREVLLELGDPRRLAARYMERPRALIGQEVFPEYLRTLKVVLAVAVPSLAVLAAVGAAFGDDPGAGDVIGAFVTTAFETAIQVAFWVTLVYAFADRWKDARPWSLDELPEAPTTNESSSGVGEAVFGVVVTALAGVALVWQHVRSPLRDDDGERVPFLDPDLWGGPGEALLALLAASVLVQALVLVRRRWTYPLAGANGIVNLGFLGVVAWLALDERLINPRFLEVLADRSDWAVTPSVDPLIPIVLVAIIEVWDAAAAVVAARRAEARRDARRSSSAAPGSAPAG